MSTGVRPAIAAVVSAAALLFASHAGAGTASAVPFQIEATSLGQDGQQLVWQLRVGGPFSPGALARTGRSLCLLIEDVGGGNVVGQLCVAGPARRSTVPRLVYAPVTRAGLGRVRVIDATVTRGSTRELTASFLPASVGLSYRPLRWQALSAAGAPGCVPPASGPNPCQALRPATPTLVALHIPQLAGCAPAGPSLVYRGSARVRQIALTFDDGPWPTPPPSAFLQVLERYHVPATFFEIGRQISTYDPRGAYERRMLADGAMIGDHTWSHPDMTRLSPSGQSAQLLDTAAAIRKATGGFTPCLWRPPYGSVNSSVVSLARSLGFLTVMWDVDPRDWAAPGVAAIYGNVAINAHNGAIVLQHFGGGPRYQTVAALSQEIPTLRRRGYTFVTVAQMLGLRLIYR